MNNVRENPLLDNHEELETVDRVRESSGSKKKVFLYGTIICGSIIIGVIIGMMAAFAYKPGTKHIVYNQYDALPDCQTYSSFSCSGSNSAMDSKYFENRWNTPKRGQDAWKPGFQDMSTLAGYAQLKYAAGMKSCTVNIITKTSRDLSLTYYFDGVAQTSSSKTFDSSYNKVLKVKVIAASGEILELDGIDFAWNAAAIKSRSYDYRKGQKGAIVELFG